MSISLVSADIRHERRIRLAFSNSLDVSAFGVPAPTAYVVTSTDGRGVSPTVSAALAVPNSPNVVELALASDLVKGAFYQISAIGIKAVDTTVTDATAVLSVLYGTPAVIPNTEPIRSNRLNLVYFVDLIWNGSDYEEAANGDLNRIGGPPNVTKALYRTVEANGLPWDGGYGGKAREFIDTPALMAGTLKGSVSSAILRDPRVKAVKADVEVSDINTYLHLTPVLISGEQADRVSVTVPNAS